MWDGVPSFAGVVATAAVMMAAVVGCAGVLAWLYRAQARASGDWAELELPAFLLHAQQTLGRAKLLDRVLLDWADEADLPPAFWDEYNHMYSEFTRCSPGPNHALFFDFWDWAKRLPKQPKALTLEKDEPPLFNLGLVVPYARLVRMELGKAAEWRHEDDAAYDTLMPLARTHRVLPSDSIYRSSRKKRGGKPDGDGSVKTGNDMNDTSYYNKSAQSKSPSMSAERKLRKKVEKKEKKTNKALSMYSGRVQLGTGKSGKLSLRNDMEEDVVDLGTAKESLGNSEDERDMNLKTANLHVHTPSQDKKTPQTDITKEKTPDAKKIKEDPEEQKSPAKTGKEEAKKIKEAGEKSPAKTGTGQTDAKKGTKEENPPPKKAKRILKVAKKTEKREVKKVAEAKSPIKTLLYRDQVQEGRKEPSPTEAKKSEPEPVKEAKEPKPAEPKIEPADPKEHHSFRTQDASGEEKNAP